MLVREQIERLKHEVDMLRALDHPFITPLHAAFQDSRRFYLVFEFLQGGELYYHHRWGGVGQSGGRGAG